MDEYDDRPRTMPAWIRITGLVLVVALVLAFSLSTLVSVLSS
jgi:hypothetical protein